MKAQSEVDIQDGREKSVATLDPKDEKWRTITTIPLPMAYVTKYLWGTDNIRYKINFHKIYDLRPNAFELRAVDGSSSGIIHCEDSRALDQWLGHIYNHIQVILNTKIN